MARGGAKAKTSMLKWIFIGAVIYVIWKCVKTDRERFQSSQNQTEQFAVSVVDDGIGTGSCGGDCTGSTSAAPSTCGAGKKLLPVLDPCFNMREICKQCILLEDHLFQTEKRCDDCIKKHFLTIEGLAEEAITLDKTNQYKLSERQLPEKVRSLEKMFIQKNSPENIAQQLRQIRKPLMAEFFDKGI